ncbi:MAG TPA: isomerase [Devosia sp.]|nr:isomerase [Devosia sp.]
MLRFSANLGLLWTELPLPDAIAAAAKAGFKAVELHYPYATPASLVKTACARHNLKLLSINTNIAPGPDGHFGLGAVPGRQNEFRTLAREALTYALEAGAGFVHIMAGCTDRYEQEAAQETFIKNLKWAASKAAAENLQILLEPLNSTDIPGYFYSRPQQAMEIIQTVGADNIALMFDAYHVGQMGDDILASLRENFAQIGHIQIASVPGRHEPDGGTFDYSALFSELEKLNYQGWIGCEYKPRTGVEAGLIWTEKLDVCLSS